MDEETKVSIHAWLLNNAKNNLSSDSFPNFREQKRNYFAGFSFDRAYLV
jgi:hypothetical protein